MLSRSDAIVIGAAGSGLLLTAVAAHQERVPAAEEVVFRWINGLPDVPSAVVWVPMQVGNVLATLAVAAAALWWRRRALASAALVGGLGSWVGAKGLKLLVERGRPGGLLEDVVLRADAHVLGPGWVSGHGAVAAALVTLAWPHLCPRARVAAVLAVFPMYLARVYIGEHLPLDMVGGALFGVAVGQGVVVLARQRDVRPWWPVSRKSILQG